MCPPHISIEHSIAQKKGLRNRAEAGRTSQITVTHFLTHTGKGAAGTNGHNSAAHHGPVEQSGQERAEKQPMNGSQSVGKDEVGSSNLPSSSNIEHSILTVWVLFVLFL